MPQQAACALAFAFTLLFFPALRIYLGNHLHYHVSLGHAVFWLAAGSVVVAALVAALGAVLPRRLRHPYAALVLGLAFFAWFKSGFLAWDYGVFVGESVDWEDYPSEARYDLIALLLFCAGFLLVRRKALARCTALAAFLAITQFVGLLVLTPFARSGDRAEILSKGTAEIDPRSSEKLSAQSNVIVLLVDTLQSDVLAQWLARDQRRAQALHGFTFFPDTVSEAGLTWLSVPNLLTGMMFDNQQSYSDYRSAAFNGPSSALKNLRSAGYYVELNPWSTATPVPRTPSLVSNIWERTGTPALEPLSSLLMVGVFTVLPQFAQQWLHPAVLAALNDFLGADSDNNLRFMRETDSLPVERLAQPVAKFIHLRGPHVPLLEYGSQGLDYYAAARQDPPPHASIARFTRKNYVQASEQMLEAVMRYLKKLEAAGVYERSTIFILGDHGGGRLGQRFIPPSAPPYGNRPGVISSGLQSAAAAALIAKPAGAGGPLTVSPAPVTLSDVGATINRMIGHEPAPGTRPLFEFDSRPRTRRFTDVAQMRFTSEGRLPTLTEYRVGTPMWRDSSWQRTGRRFTARGVRTSDPVYSPGERLDFGDGERALDYLDYGWRVPLKDARRMWTDGNVARLTLPLKAPLPEGAVLELDAGPYVAAREAKVSVNGVYIGKLKVDTRRLFSVKIPPGIVHGNVLEVRFDLPDAVSPYGAFRRPDDGLLSLEVFSMRIAEELDH